MIQFTINREQLSRELKFLQKRIIRNKKVNTENVELYVEGQILGLRVGSLVETGNEVIPTYTSTFATIINQEGHGITTSVYLKKFNQLVAKLKDGFLSIEIEPEVSITIKTKKNKYSLPLESAFESPELDLENAMRLTFKSCELKSIFEKLLKFVSTDDMKPNFNGVFMHRRNNKLSICATDAHKLSVIDIDSEGEDFNLLLHTSSVKAVLSLLEAKSEALTTLEISENLYDFKFSFRGYEVTSKGMNERFPDYEMVIPLGRYISTFYKSDMLEAIDRLSLVCNQTTNQGKFTFKEDDITIAAEDLDFSTEGSETIDTSGDADMTIGFNLKLLEILLKCTDKGMTTIDLTEPGYAATIREEAHGGRWTYLLMPIMLRNFLADEDDDILA